MLHGNAIWGLMDWILMNPFTYNLIPIGVLFLLLQFLPEGRKIGLVVGVVWFILTASGLGIQGEKLIGIYPKNPMERMKEHSFHKPTRNSLGHKGISVMEDTTDDSEIDTEPDPEEEETEVPQPAAEDGDEDIETATNDVSEGNDGNG